MLTWSVPQVSGTHWNRFAMIAATRTPEPARGRSSPASDSIFVLHVFPSFGVGGVQVRMADVINHLGGTFRHTILALDGDYACKDRLSDAVQVKLLPPPTKLRVN